MSQLLPDVSLEEDETRSTEDEPSPAAPPADENSESDRGEAKAYENTTSRTTELQNSRDGDRQRSSTKEDKNYSSVEEQFSDKSQNERSKDRPPSATPDRASSAAPARDASTQDASTDPAAQDSATQDSERRGPAPDGLSVFPDNRPDLSQKLGPYVSTDVDDALEDVYLLLRRRFGAKASKSLVVEVALRYILRDCLDREEESELMRWFDRVLDT